jgi:protein CpxP
VFGAPEPVEIENSLNRRNIMKSIRIFAAVATVLLTVAAMAQGPRGFGGPDGDFHRMLKQLDLTSDQQSQVKAIFEKEKPTLQPLMQAMRANHTAMSALESSGTFDEAKTRALATQNSQTMVELQVEHARLKSEIMQVLTADQKAKLVQIQADHQARMGQHAPAPPDQD